MFVVRIDGQRWSAKTVALRYRSGDLIGRFSNPAKLLEFLRRRPRTNYFLEAVVAGTPLPSEYSLDEDDIVAGQIWFDPDQNKIVTN